MDYTPNKKTLKERADYGVRVARPGYDAYNCAQNQLLFNSNWPILQITKVVDFANMEENDSVGIYEVMSKVIDKNTGQLVSTSSSTSELEEPPTGYTSTSSYSYNPSDSGEDYRELCVNKKYIRKYVAGTITSYNYPEEIVETPDRITYTTKYYRVYPIAKKSHRMGFTPFFITSDQVSDISGYMLLFSVDIATDVDYPYTEEPLALLNPKCDYGIKSKSIFGSKVPGLSSGMFSKLVQAVKTEKTITATNGDKRAIWSPVKSAAEAKGGELLPYEFYSFIGNAYDDAGIDGGAYYRRDYPFYMSRNNGSTMSDAWAVTTTSFQDWVRVKNSLVVLRSPLVSPEYEEIIV